MQQRPNGFTITPAAPQQQQPVCKVSQLTKMYQDRTVVNQLNLDVNRGEIFGFLGPNGAGKTTTIRMILGWRAYGKWPAYSCCHPGLCSNLPGCFHGVNATA